ncbi:MAG: AAA family ATPase [Legionella sp.]|nr:AAA family ATPase [Legionella sp.]
MRRNITQSLIRWKDSASRMPLMLRGARQVGKSYVVSDFAATHFEHCVEVNFEMNPEFKHAFSKLDPLWITEQITLLSGQKITPAKTLLFLDEIQECPEAIQSLRYFKEKMPELHVITAGSLLEFALSDATFRMPVGRVEFMYMYPMTFNEFLYAIHENELCYYLINISLKTDVSVAAHEKSLELFRLYMTLGGMPAVIADYAKHKDLQNSRKLQLQLLSTYRNDFGKYATHAEKQYCEKLFTKAPGLIAKHFRYRDVDPDVQSRSIKSALNLLEKAQLVNRINQVSSIQLPLSANINEKKFKLLFVDIGLVLAAMRVDMSHIINASNMISTKGQLSEQIVGQELLAHAPSYDALKLYFWMRDKTGSQAEVDYLYQHNNNVLPIEVKSSAFGRLKSLRLYLDAMQQPFGIKISSDTLSMQQQLLNVPIYLISRLSELVADQIV